MVCRRAFNRLYRVYVLRHIARPSEARFLGRRFVTHPDVFHPVYFLSTRILARHVEAMDLAGKRFLDMGTGSGALGIVASSRGAEVTACDINPKAVETARENARRNGARMEVLQSDLFSAVEGRTFDVVCFNIPFYPKEPSTDLERAFYAGRDFATVRAFASGCASVVAEGGTAVVIFSEDSNYERIVSFFAGAGLSVRRSSVTQKFFERFHVVAFDRRH